MSNNILNGEEWRDIAGYEGVYQVSNLGQVKRVGGSILKVNVNRQRKNRCTVVLSYNHKQTRKAIHHLVAYAFPDICGEWFDGAEIDHKDTDPTNNKAENLHWVTRIGNMANPLTKEHMLDMYDDGRREAYSKRMKENNPSKLPGAWTDERRKALSDRNRARWQTIRENNKTKEC